MNTQRNQTALTNLKIALASIEFLNIDKELREVSSVFNQLELDLLKSSQLVKHYKEDSERFKKLLNDQIINLKAIQIILNIKGNQHTHRQIEVFTQGAEIVIEKMIDKLNVEINGLPF